MYETGIPIPRTKTIRNRYGRGGERSKGRLTLRSSRFSSKLFANLARAFVCHLLFICLYVGIKAFH